VQGHLDSGDVGQLFHARHMCYGGNWLRALDPMLDAQYSKRSREVEDYRAADCLPAWLPEEWHKTYTGYLQMYTHNVNYLRYMIENEAAGRVATVHNVCLASNGYDGMVVLDFGEDRRGVVESGRMRTHLWYEEAEAFFEDQSLHVSPHSAMVKQWSAPLEIRHNGREDDTPRIEQIESSPGWAYRLEVQHFLECLQTGEPFRSGAQDTLKDVEIMEEIYRRFLGV
jgi:predicted dehydrogenase